MNRQAIFNRVCAHLFVQGCRSANHLEICFYQSNDGLRCAIGALLTRGELSLDPIGTVDRVLRDFPQIGDRLGISNDDDTLFLRTLQRVHDQLSNIRHWPEVLRDVAAQFGLSVPAIIAERSHK